MIEKKATKFKKFKKVSEKIRDNIKKKFLTGTLYVLISTSVFFSLPSCGGEPAPQQTVSDVAHDISSFRDGGYVDANPSDTGSQSVCKNEDLSKYVVEPYKKDFKLVCDSCKYDFGLLEDSEGNFVEEELQRKGTEFIRYVCLFESQIRMEELCADERRPLTYVIATNKMPEKENAVKPPEGVNKTNSIAHWELPIDGDTLEPTPNGCRYYFWVRSGTVDNYVPSYYTYKDFFWVACQAGAIGKLAPDASPKIYRCSPPCTIVMNGVYGGMSCAEKMCCDYFKNEQRVNEICEAVLSVKVNCAK
ncbi:MAG: hypothetical protein QXF35_03520 [Candidatus Bilamarchaeaceae archaeon]